MNNLTLLIPAKYESESLPLVLEELEQETVELEGAEALHATEESSQNEGEQELVVDAPRTCRISILVRSSSHDHFLRRGAKSGPSPLAEHVLG